LNWKERKKERKKWRKGTRRGEKSRWGREGSECLKSGEEDDERAREGGGLPLPVATRRRKSEEDRVEDESRRDGREDAVARLAGPPLPDALVDTFHHPGPPTAVAEGDPALPEDCFVCFGGAQTPSPFVASVLVSGHF
jgi:hypothetical protein